MFEWDYLVIHKQNRMTKVAKLREIIILIKVNYTGNLDLAHVLKLGQCKDEMISENVPRPTL